MNNKERHNSGFTLLELMISLGIVMLVGMAVWTVLHTVMVLSSKNEAINVTHQQGREVINRIEQQFRSAVSVPQLIDASFNAVSGTTQAAGVQFQTIFCGPNKVYNGCGNNEVNIQITTNPAVDARPSEGMRLIIPGLQVEADIDRTTGGEGPVGFQNIHLQKKFGSYTTPTDQGLTCNNGDPVFVAYITQLSAFLLVAGELRYYPHYPNGKYVVIARDLGTTTPFSFKDGDSRALAVNFVSSAPNLRARNYHSMDMAVLSVLPYRYRLTTRQ